MPFYRWSDVLKDVHPGRTLPAGMSRRAVVTGENMVALHEALPDLKCKPHTHASTQVSYILQGRLRMWIGGEEQVIGPGEFAFVPAGVEHSIESLDEYVLILDVFSPSRPDIAARLAELESGVKQ